MALRRTFRAALALFPLAMVAACVEQPPALPKAEKTLAPPATVISTDVTAPQPRASTYRCTDGGMMTIENLGTSLRLLGPDGSSEELPASPANQRSRYGADHDAVVIDGREALVMKGGMTPLTCTR